MKQYENPSLAECYNIGPEEKDCVSTGMLADSFCNLWKKLTGRKVQWINQHDGGPHEASFLKLDCSKIQFVFGWEARWNIEYALAKSIELYLVCCRKEDVFLCIRKQMEEYLEVWENLFL